MILGGMKEAGEDDPTGEPAAFAVNPIALQEELKEVSVQA
jgi:hypothetical protein